MKRSWYATPYALWMLMFTIVPYNIHIMLKEA